MKWNPIFNAVGAAVYIGIVASFIRYISSFRHDTPDTFLDSVGFLSLFVCSAAVMAFLFFYRPLMLLVENKKADAVSYFFKTLGSFAIITLLVLAFVTLQGK